MVLYGGDGEGMVGGSGGTHIWSFDRGGELHGSGWSRRREGCNCGLVPSKLIDGPRHARHRNRRPRTASPCPPRSQSPRLSPATDARASLCIAPRINSPARPDAADRDAAVLRTRVLPGCTHQLPRPSPSALSSTPQATRYSSNERYIDNHSTNTWQT